VKGVGATGADASACVISSAVYSPDRSIGNAFRSARASAHFAIITAGFVPQRPDGFPLNDEPYSWKVATAYSGC
jgi:hypothetical protein